MTQHTTGRRLRLAAGAAALLLALTACATGGADPGATTPAPAPTTEAPAPESTATADPAADAAPLEPSRPLRVRIDRVGLDAELMVTGMRADGTLEVPPGEEGSPGSWYDGSPTPGERGTSVLTGHVNSLSDESGAFFELHQAAEGDVVAVEREDGTTATFEIYRVDTFEKDDFPTREIYFPASGPELRLITCDDLGQGGDAFPNNFIAFARLVDGG